MCSANIAASSAPAPSCTESFGNTVDGKISRFFQAVGHFVGGKPSITIAACIALTVACGSGFVSWETENRGEELWVPQNTVADTEESQYLAQYPRTARFNQLIVQSAEPGGNVLTLESLEQAMEMHFEIQTKQAEVEEEGSFGLLDLCVKGGASCSNFSLLSNSNGTTTVCSCLITGILRQWNYDLETLRNDSDGFLDTLNAYGTQEDLEAVLGNPVFDDNGSIVSAEAFTLNYFLLDRSIVENGSEVDPINEGWEEEVFLKVAESDQFPLLQLEYFATRSFSDVFGDAIGGDLGLVQISYVVAFLFLGATMGRIKCGTGSRWTMALAALMMVVLSTAAGFGISSHFGLFFGPVHSLLPFVLLGIGVDDAFVIINAFNRERKVPRAQEDNEGIRSRSSAALGRAGASITVTSLTDLVAFAISSSSALPALASFCAYAAICIFFLWLFASTFFTACLVIDERRQRDNRRECLCCFTRNDDLKEDGDSTHEGAASRYFRNYHAPSILSQPGKIVVFAFFAALIGFGAYGAANLSVEDSSRNFVPANSYLANWLSAGDQYFAAQGSNVQIVFEESSNIYSVRQELSELSTRLSGLSTSPPFISEPVSEESYRNVMNGLAQYLAASGTDAIGGVTLGSDNWPATEADFVLTLSQYVSFAGPGAVYAQDVTFSEDGSQVNAVSVQLEYVRLVKTSRGELINDASKQIDAMDATRTLVDSWDDLQPAFPYSENFLNIEGYKIIRQELFQNVGLAIIAVGIIVFLTIGSPLTALLVTLNVAFCIVEILGFMFALGIVIDSVSVINIVLAVGLSVDYSAHVGHCFMVKGGKDKNLRVTESLADIGAAVVSGGISTFLAVVVLLFSKSYVFNILSKQFALTVILGLAHGLIALPVVLSVFGPQPFSSAEVSPNNDAVGLADDKIRETGRPAASTSEEEPPEDARNDELHA